MNALIVTVLNAQTCPIFYMATWTTGWFAGPGRRVSGQGLKGETRWTEGKRAGRRPGMVGNRREMWGIRVAERRLRCRTPNLGAKPLVLAKNGSRPRSVV